MGMIKPTTETYSRPSFFTLMGNLRKMKTSQKTRFWGQICSLLLANILVTALVKTPPQRQRPGRLAMINAGGFGLRVSQSFTGIFYEMFAPEIASGRVNRLWMTICWIAVQIPIFLYPLKLITHGGIGRESWLLRGQLFVRTTLRNPSKLVLRYNHVLAELSSNQMFLNLQKSNVHL